MAQRIPPDGRRIPERAESRPGSVCPMRAKMTFLRTPGGSSSGTGTEGRSPMRRGQVVALSAGGAVVVAAGITIGVVLATGGGDAAPAAGTSGAPATQTAPAAGASPSADGLTPAQRALAATLG